MSLPSITISIFDDRLPDNIASARHWQAESACLFPSALARLSSNQRQQTSFVVVMFDSSPVGIMPLRQPKLEEFASPLLNPALVAPSILGDRRLSAREYLFIGATRELVSGLAYHAGLSTEDLYRVTQLLGDEALAEACRRGLLPAIMYVRDRQAANFGNTWTKSEIAAFASLEVDGEDDDGYIGTLNHGRRSTVLRDLRQLTSRGLSSEPVLAISVIEEAAPLVSSVRVRNGLLDHPRLALTRLRDWASEPLGDRLSFVVRNENGEILAACFACKRDDVLELFEVGITPTESPVRHLAYVESMVYGPRRYAAKVGCRTVQMGIGATRPKVLRGAKLHPVWAMSVLNGDS